MKCSLRERRQLKIPVLRCQYRKKTFYVIFKARVFAWGPDLLLEILYIFSRARWERNGGKNEYLSWLRGIFSARALKRTQNSGDLECRRLAHVRIIFNNDCLLESKQNLSPQSLVVSLGTRSKWSLIVGSDVILRGCGWAIQPYGCYLTATFPFTETSNFFSSTMFQ